MKQIIYADNAATTKLKKEAYDAMVPYLFEEYGNPSQLYSFSRSSKNALKEARQTIAACINASPNEIYFTSGGTESDNWAIKGSAFALGKKRDVLTSVIEHHAVLRSCKFIETQGYHVTYLPVNTVGEVMPQTLSEAISDCTGLVSIMYANNEIGTVQPIKNLANIAHKHGAKFHTDAVQVIGHIAVDVKELNVDLLSASAHKFGGPKGVGFLYIKNGINILPYLNGGSQEFSYRAGTENIAAIVGMAVALQASVNNLELNRNLYNEEQYFINKLQDAGLVLGDDFIWNGNHELQNHLPGIISLSFRNKDGEAIMHRLDLKGIMIATGAACDTRMTQVSHVIKAIELPEEYQKGTIRISFNSETSHTDIALVADELIKILK